MQHCVQCTVHAEGCSATSCLGTTFCAAQGCGQSCFNAASEFSPFVPNFSLVPSHKENIQCVPETKTVQKENSVAGAGPGWPGADWEGPIGMGGLALLGWGPALGQPGGRGDWRVYP